MNSVTRTFRLLPPCYKNMTFFFIIVAFHSSLELFIIQHNDNVALYEYSNIMDITAVRESYSRSPYWSITISGFLMKVNQKTGFEMRRLQFLLTIKLFFINLVVKTINWNPQKKLHHFEQTDINNTRWITWLGQSIIVDGMMILNGDSGLEETSVRIVQLNCRVDSVNVLSVTS
jgi:hypothetical protein